MKTSERMNPNEIVKALRGMGRCSEYKNCTDCPINELEDYDCYNHEHSKQLLKDTLDYIERLEAELKAVNRERDAAVSDLTKAMSLDGVEDCSFCKNIKKTYCHPCKFEWRGVCPENTKEE